MLGGGEDGTQEGLGLGGGGIRMLDQSTGHSPPGEYAPQKTSPVGKSI
jgi:hypothetical protein